MRMKKPVCFLLQSRETDPISVERRREWLSRQGYVVVTFVERPGGGKEPEAGLLQVLRNHLR